MRHLLATLCLFAATLALAPASHAQSPSPSTAQSSNPEADTSSLAMAETSVADANGNAVISTRLIGQKLTEKWGQNIVVDGGFSAVTI